MPSRAEWYASQWLGRIVANCQVARSSQVLVSHEQYFVQRVAREVHIVEGGKVRPMESFAAHETFMAKKLRPLWRHLTASLCLEKRGPLR